MAPNNLIHLASQNRVCTALGIKLVPSNEIISLAKSTGYDSVFVDLEHSVFNEKDASRLCSAALTAGITPFVRVPHECGSGYVQRVLDGGAMGIVFPHVKTPDDARKAVRYCKFPPNGQRSLTNALPHFEFQRIRLSDVIQQLDSTGSTVFLMVESRECLENIDAIAAVEGVDALLIGANDLSLELGVLGAWEGEVFQKALEKVATAARAAGKIFGICGLYTRPDISKKVVRELGARFVLCTFDITLLAMAMSKSTEVLRDFSVGL